MDHSVNDNPLTLTDIVLRQALMDEIGKQWLYIDNHHSCVLNWRGYVAEYQLSTNLTLMTVTTPYDDFAGINGGLIKADENTLDTFNNNELLARTWAMEVMIEDYIRRQTWNPYCRRILPLLQEKLYPKIQESLTETISDDCIVDIFCVSMDKSSAGKAIDKMSISDDPFMLLIHCIMGESATSMVGTFDKLSTAAIPSIAFSDKGGYRQPKSPNAYIIEEAEIKSIKIAAAVLPIVKSVATELNYHVFNGGYYIVNNDFVLMFRLIEKEIESTL